MDTIFFHISYKGHGTKAEIKEISAIRMNEKGTQVASRTEAVSDEVSVSKCIERVGNEMLSLQFADQKFVVVSYHAFHMQLLRQAEDKIAEAAKKTSEAPLFEGRMWLDVTQLAWPLRHCGLLKDASLKGLVDYFKLPGYSNSGSSSEDAMFVARIYWAMMRAYNAGMKAEAFATELGGDGLAAVRQLVGF